MNKSSLDCLIIDDDPTICEALKTYSEKLGVFRNIIIATDGGMGSNKLRNQKFGLILLDVNMPRKNGIDVLLDFDTSSLNSTQDIIMVSGEFDRDKIFEITKLGVKSFLSKPFSEGQFQQKVIPILKKNLAAAKLK